MSSPRQPTVESAPERDLPALVARLGDDIVSLLDSRLSLLKLDVEEEGRRYARELIGLAMAGVVAAVGITMAAASSAFALAYLLPERLDPLLARALAFGAIGALGIGLGIVGLRRREIRLGTPSGGGA